MEAEWSGVEKGEWAEQGGKAKPNDCFARQPSAQNPQKIKKKSPRNNPRYSPNIPQKFPQPPNKKQVQLTFNLLCISSTRIMRINLFRSRTLIQRNESMKEVVACGVVVVASGVVGEVVA